jgi:hypothetical protein
MTRVAALGALAALAFVLTAPAADAGSAREVHGSADAYAMPGVALAWAVLRTPKEEDTAVVIRIDVDTRTYGWIEVVGKDPFTEREERLQPLTAVGGVFDLRTPRTRFADFPRTEIRLWQKGAAPGGASPALVVYYLGVPDTTPEIAQAAELDRSLASRIAGARADAARRMP